MTSHLRNALVRSVLVTVLVVGWVLFYDGPSWAWAMLAVYIGCTFGVAMFLQSRMRPAPEKDKSDDA
jgi:hypothetical protein